jgi:putative endonuclease
MRGLLPKRLSPRIMRGVASVLSAGAGVASAGEIDLILREDDRVIFVEVKKSRDFARAAESLSYWQMQRILGAAEEFVAGEPKGLLTEMRFDVALVDAVGRIEILENACLAA